jgi:hypothetical protein
MLVLCDSLILGLSASGTLILSCDKALDAGCWQEAGGYRGESILRSCGTGRRLDGDLDPIVRPLGRYLKINGMIRQAANRQGSARNTWLNARPKRATQPDSPATKAGDRRAWYRFCRGDLYRNSSPLFRMKLGSWAWRDPSTQVPTRRGCDQAGPRGEIPAIPPPRLCERLYAG